MDVGNTTTIGEKILPDLLEERTKEENQSPRYRIFRTLENQNEQEAEELASTVEEKRKKRTTATS